MYKIRETSQCYNKFTHDRVIVDHNNIEKRRRIGIPCSLRIGKSKKFKWLNNSCERKKRTTEQEAGLDRLQMSICKGETKDSAVIEILQFKIVQ